MKRLRLLALVAICTTFVWAFTGAQPAAATVTNLISFQGKLTNPDGTNVVTNTYTIVFSLYPVASGGAAVWSESKSVTVTDGLFHTNLGDATALPGSVNFNSSSLYLGIKVGADAEMTPRVRLTASPQAINSDMLDGMDSSAFIQLSPGAQQSGNLNISGTIASGNINGQTIGSASTLTGTLTIQGASTLTLGSASSNRGAVILRNAAGANTVTIQAPTANPASSFSLTLPSSLGATGDCLKQNDAAGTLAFANCNPTLQAAYDNNAAGSPADITTTSATKTFLFKAGATFDSASLFQVQSAGSATLFTIDSSASQVEIGNAVADSTGVLLVLDSKNTTGDPTGVNGAMYYNSANNDFRVQQNSRWANIQPVRYAYLTADRATTSTAYANVTDLSFAVDANTNYEMVCSIVYQTAATTTGIGLSLNGPASPNLVVGQFIANTSATALNGRSFNAYNGGNKTTGVQTANANTYGTFRAYFRNGGTAGTLQLRYASEVSGSTATIKANSYCRLSEL